MIQITFRGDEANNHQIEAYTGSESLAGFGRACTIVAHYTATETVRFRRPYDESVRFLIEAVQPGSLSIVMSAISTAVRPLQAQRLSRTANKILGHVVQRAVGRARPGTLELADLRVSEGDVDALAEAITPGISRAHSWIDSGNKSIILTGDRINDIVFDEETKEYISSEVHAENEEVQDVSVGALNVNSRTGRVFFHDLGRTVPFWVPRNASARTIPTLAGYLSQYANRTGATVNIRFRRVTHLDDRLKKIIISDCYAIAGRG